MTAVILLQILECKYEFYLSGLFPRHIRRLRAVGGSIHRLIIVVLSLPAADNVWTAVANCTSSRDIGTAKNGNVGKMYTCGFSSLIDVHMLSFQI